MITKRGAVIPVLAVVLNACAPTAPNRPASAQIREPKRESAPDHQEVLRGREVFLNGPCVMCHTIRGTIAGSRAGPDLTHLASRRSIAAGTLPNTRGNLAAWILNPQNLKPGTQMPPTLLKPEDLHSLLAFLESLE